jgi:hypothetical protein
MNYYKATSETLRLIQDLHKLNGDMEWVKTEGVGPFEGENLDGSKCPDVHGAIYEQLQGWMNISNYFLDIVNHFSEQLAAAQETEKDAIDELYRESEKRTKIIENLKRKIQLKNKSIREIKQKLNQSNTTPVEEPPPL